MTRQLIIMIIVIVVAVCGFMMSVKAQNEVAVQDKTIKKIVASLERIEENQTEMLKYLNHIRRKV